MLLENQCIKTASKNACVFEIHRWLLAFPEISIVKPCAPLKPLVPFSFFKQILQQASKIYTKEDDGILLEIPRNQDTRVDVTQTGSKCFHFRILADKSKEKKSSIFSTCRARLVLFFIL